MAKYDDSEYLLRRVITHSTHARTLIHAVRRNFIGDQQKRMSEALEKIDESIGYLEKVRLDIRNGIW